MRNFVMLVSVALVFAACKDRNRDVTATQPINLNGNLSSAQGNAGKTNPQFTTSGNTAGLRVNPAHGQPGHRCDLDVGAPLPASNSTSTAVTPQITRTETPIQTTIQPQQTVATNPNVSASTTKAGTNPAHGQPGHRCDIAVGAPLNSAPAKTTVEPIKAVQNATVTPVTTNTPVAPGMNPQHGQPGHRCDIAVGAPLNSAPAKVESAVVKDSAKG